MGIDTLTGPSPAVSAALGRAVVTYRMLIATVSCWPRPSRERVDRPSPSPSVPMPSAATGTLASCDLEPVRHAIAHW
jgi:hypothetical protein